MKPIIEVKGLSKRYKLGVFNARTLREEAEAFFARFKRKNAHTAEGIRHTVSGPAEIEKVVGMAVQRRLPEIRVWTAVEYSRCSS